MVNPSGVRVNQTRLWSRPHPGSEGGRTFPREKPEIHVSRASAVEGDEQGLTYAETQRADRQEGKCRLSSDFRICKLEHH